MRRLTYLNESRETTELTQFEGDSWQELIKNADVVDQIFMNNAIDKLYEYEDLEEQGLLLKLPCKIGDETYWIDDEDEDGNKGLCVKGKSYVEAIGVDKDGFLISTGDGSWDRPNKSRWCFLTKEEAEQELKRLECAE